MLSYENSEGDSLAHIDCVGASAAMPLLDQARPFNLRISLESRMARAWTSGREVVVMMETADGWRRIEFIALLNKLIFGPEETEKGLLALSLKGVLNFKVMGNLEGYGVTEDDISLTNVGYAQSMTEHEGKCRREFR